LQSCEVKSRNRELKMLYFSFVTIKLSKLTASWKSNYESIVIFLNVEELVSRLRSSTFFLFLTIDTLYRGASIDADISSMFRKIF